MKSRVLVLDVKGHRLSPTTEEKAQRLIEAHQAIVVQTEPLTIQLQYETPGVPPLPERPSQADAEGTPLPGQGRRMLLHICCAPCSTYTVKHLRELAFDVTGYWYNPNIGSLDEHERRRETLQAYAQRIELPMVWEPGYETAAFMQSIRGQEKVGIRCRVCYRMRLERTAQTAQRGGYDVFTTTLLISPYQNQEVIRAIGEEMAARYGVEFYFENFRRGWAEHWKIVREHGLYTQKYCGCILSEWEALERQAASMPPQPFEPD